jgi:hypothetical protein
MTKREKQSLTIRFALGLGMAIIVGMLFNLWQMHDRLDSMNRDIEDWKHIIDFLKLWIQQNDLQITPPAQTT